MDAALNSAAIPPHVTLEHKQAFKANLYVACLFAYTFLELIYWIRHSGKRQKKAVFEGANDFAMVCRRLDNTAGYT